MLFIYGPWFWGAREKVVLEAIVDVVLVSLGMVHSLGLEVVLGPFKGLVWLELLLIILYHTLFL